jgi:hypothetical protein
MLKYSTYIFFFSLIFLSNDFVIAQSKEFPKGAAKKLTVNDVIRLKNYLNDTNWVEAKKIFFGPTYDKSLPDLICYIKSNGDVKLGLTKENSEDNPVLYGEKKLSVIIFSDKDLNNYTTLKIVNTPVIRDTARDAAAFTVRNEPLQFDLEPSEVTISGLLKFIMKILGANSSTENSKKETGESKPVKLQIVETDQNEKINSDGILYYGTESFELSLNSTNRIIIEPQKKDDVKFRFIDYKFGNFESSPFASSVGVGYRFDTGHNVDAYVFVHFYPFKSLRPKLPLKTFSLGIVLGSSIITNPLLHNVVFGARVGFKFLRQLGIIFGGNYSQSIDKEIRGFIGIDCRL